MSRACPLRRSREAAEHEYAGLAHAILRGLAGGYPVDGWASNVVEYVTHVEHRTAFFSERRIHAAVEFLARSFDRGSCRWVEIGNERLRQKYTRHVLEDVALQAPDAFSD